MNITADKRTELLMGDNERAARNLPLRGWSDASLAPRHFQDRIIEVRLAIEEKRSVPAPSAAYCAAAEQRSTLARRAINFGKRLFWPSTIAVEETLEQTAARQADELSFERGAKLPTLAVARAVSRRTGRSFEDILAEGRSKVFNRQHGLDAQATGPMTEDEKESFKRAFDRSMGLRPQGV